MPDCGVKGTRLVDVGFNLIFFIEYFIYKAAPRIVAGLLLNCLVLATVIPCILEKRNFFHVAFIIHLLSEFILSFFNVELLH